MSVVEGSNPSNPILLTRISDAAGVVKGLTSYQSVIWQKWSCQYMQTPCSRKYLAVDMNCKSVTRKQADQLVVVRMRSVVKGSQS